MPDEIREVKREWSHWQWTLIGFLCTLLLAISGAILSTYQTRLTTLEVLVHTQGERTAVIEAKFESQSAQVDKRLQRIEDKLDKVLEEKRAGK